MDKYRFKVHNEYLFIGAIGDAETIRSLNSKGCNVSTGYNVQRKMIEGLEKLGHYSDTITGHVSPALKRDTLIVDYKSKDRSDYVTDISVSFLNIPLIDKLIKKIKISKAAKCWAAEKNNPKIFVYSLASNYLLGALAAKKKNPKCRITVIVPDLPEFMSNSTNKVYRMLKKIDRRIIDRSLRKVDSFVLFSGHMKDKIDINNKPYVVVEGIIRDIEEDAYLALIEKRITEHKKIIMLSGNLDYEEGIQTLLDAFVSIDDPECRLWLTGNGNAVEMIQKYQQSDKRIIYYGYIDSYNEFLKLQQQAYVFVQMVSPAHPKAAYFFPSKLMEYLSTGGIVACYKLPCIPDEYDEYLQYFSGDTLQIGRQLKEYCDMDSESYRKLAMERYKFLKQKSPAGQMKKVEDMVEMLS